MRLYSLDIKPTRKSNTVTLSLEKREADRFCERERDKSERSRRRGNEPPGSSSSHRCWFFQIIFFRLSFLYFRKTIRIPPFIYTVRSCISIAALFYFSTILFERRTPLLLCPSAKKCSRSISSRAFCEFLRSRRVFSGAISRDKSDGRRINIHQRERKKKRFWRQCPILNPMTAR